MGVGGECDGRRESEGECGDEGVCAFTCKPCLRIRSDDRGLEGVSVSESVGVSVSESESVSMSVNEIIVSVSVSVGFSLGVSGSGRG